MISLTMKPSSRAQLPGEKLRGSNRLGIADRDARDRCLRWGWRQSRRLHVYGADVHKHLLDISI
jgi:hypothetical protein